MKNSFLSQTISEGSELTYGGAAIAIAVVLIIFGSVIVWAKKGKLA